MPKKRTLSPEHLAKLQAGRAKKLAEKEAATDPVAETETVDNTVDDVSSDQDTNDLHRQIRELKENMDLMRQIVLNNNQQQQGNFSNTGKRLGYFEKYLVDPTHYPDPTKRLAKESRLAPLAFEHNYELEYKMDVTEYETKTGENIKEPRFYVTLLRVVLDDQGNRVQVSDPKTGKLQDKFYIARKLIFHEDPQSALVMARENGINVEEMTEQVFLNEMRYLRVRDWLFDIFWPRPTQDMQSIQDEVIGGQIVQVFTRNSEESGSIPFDKMTSKLRV